MSQDLRRALDSLVDTLLRLAESSPELKSQLAAVAQAGLAHWGGAPLANPTTAAPPSSAVQSDLEDNLRGGWTGYSGAAYGGAAVKTVAGPLPHAATPAEPWRAVPRPAATDDAWSDSAVKVKLNIISDRLRLKADATRWAQERAKLVASGANYETEIEPRDNELLTRAQTLGREHGDPIYLWVLDANAPTPYRPSQFDELAGSYQAAAEAYDLLAHLFPHREAARELFQRAMEMAAEAQNAIRSAAAELDWEDRDQSEAFGWLKLATRIERIYIARYMRAQDAADPARYRDLLDRIASLRQTSVVSDGGRRPSGAASRFKSEAEQVVEAGAAAPPDAWERLLHTVDDMVRDGSQVGDSIFRQTLAPLIDRMPPLEQVPSGAVAVLRDVDRFVSENPDTSVAVREVGSSEIDEVRDLLDGRSLVLISDYRRPQIEEAIRRTFGLRALHWITASGDPALSDLETYANRRDVACIVLASWFSSRNASDIRDICEQYDQPLVEVTSGCTPQRLAEQILDQIGDELGGASSPSFRQDGSGRPGA